MKDRFNILDTYAISRELQYFKNWRLNNIYDIDNKTFLLKFDDFQNKKKKLYHYKIWNIFISYTSSHKIEEDYLHLSV